MSIRNGKFTRTDLSQAAMDAGRNNPPAVRGDPSPWVPEQAGRIDDPEVQLAEGGAYMKTLADMQEMRGVNVPSRDSADAHDTDPGRNVPIMPANQDNAGVK